MPILFRPGKATKAAVITSEHGGPGAFEETVEEEGASVATIRSANKTTWSIANYKKNLKIPREFYMDDQHDSIARNVSRLGARARTTQDKKAFDIYAGGFDDHTTSDGVYVWSASHVALDGSTIDNLESGVMNPDNLEILVRTLLEQKAQDGEIGAHNAEALLVPPILFPDANEFLKSELKANVTDNNLNYFSTIYPGLRIFESPFVGSTYHAYTNAQTAHYLVSRNHSITRWVREDVYTVLVPWQYDDKDRWTYKAGYREVSGAVSWEGAVASSGA